MTTPCTPVAGCPTRLPSRTSVSASKSSRPPPPLHVQHQPAEAPVRHRRCMFLAASIIGSTQHLQNAYTG
ncbi:unnamed protein product [Urochloa humidicola]